MRPPSNSSNSPRRSRTTPRASRAGESADVPAEDIDDWLNRKPARARGKTRRAIRQSASGEAPKKSAKPAARPTMRVRKPRQSIRPSSGEHPDFAHTAPKPRAKSSLKSPAEKATTGGKAPRARRPLWQRIRKLCVFLLLVLACEGVAAALSSARFAVGEVAVEGARETDGEQLDTICASLVGQNFLRANRVAAEEQTRAIPTVASAHVRRDWTAWPPRLVLEVVERVPFARVGGGESWQVVDESGMPFRAARKDDENLYAVTGPRLQAETGKPLDEKAWKPVVQFAQILKKDGERAGGWNLRRVYFDRHGFASLRLTGGANDETLVQLGAGDWSEKLRTARWALADFAANNRHAAAINLISSSVTTWTPRDIPEKENSEPDGATPGETPQSETSRSETSRSETSQRGTPLSSEASGAANPA